VNGNPNARLEAFCDGALERIRFRLMRPEME